MAPSESSSQEGKGSGQKASDDGVGSGAMWLNAFAHLIPALFSNKSNEKKDTNTTSDAGVPQDAINTVAKMACSHGDNKAQFGLLVGMGALYTLFQAASYFNKHHERKIEDEREKRAHGERMRYMELSAQDSKHTQLMIAIAATVAIAMLAATGQPKAALGIAGIMAALAAVSTGVRKPTIGPVSGKKEG